MSRFKTASLKSTTVAFSGGRRGCKGKTRDGRSRPGTHADRVADQHRVRERRLVGALVAKRRAEDRVADRRPHHQTEGEDAVDEDPAVDGALGELGVEVQRDSPSAP